MLIRLLCWILGHRTVHQTFTGQQFKSVNPLTGMEVPGNYYKWTKTPFCTRCGKTVHQD